MTRLHKAGPSVARNARAWLARRAFFRSERPDVSILIPAWQSETFIERTLLCARRQTHDRVRILISIDASNDKTVEICRCHARSDARIAVFEQTQRLGWARNVNLLLDATETAFFFLYFHDDIITPNYTARLLEALRGRRDAASAHCDVGHFGESEDISVGRGYEGSAAERLASFLVAPTRGAPLRSMTRRSAAEDLRMPTDGAAGFWANHPYLMALVVAGPALHVPEVLYKRWDQRKGGLTDGWRGLTPQEMRDGLRANTKAALAVVDRATTSAAEREMLRFCAFLFLMQVVRNVEAQRGTNLFESPGELHESFAAMAPPPALENSTAEIREWARASYSNLTSFPEGRRR